MKVQIKTTIQKNFRDVFKKFDLLLFSALKPPLVPMKIERFDGCKKGDEVHLIVAGQRWVSHITELYQDDEQIYFVDIGAIIPYPLKSWKHIHRIESIGKETCQIVDDIEYSTGNSFTDKLIFPMIFSMFALRRPIYKRELE